MLKKVLVVVLLCFLSSACFAVEGYEDYRFGMSIKEIQKKVPCTLEDITRPNQTKLNTRALACKNFPFNPFNDQDCLAVFEFVNGRFLNLQFVLPSGDSEKAGNVLRSLLGKYGHPSSQPTEEELAKFKNEIPGAELNCLFDNNTICLRSIITNSKDIVIALIYTSKDFNSEQMKYLWRK